LAQTGPRWSCPCGTLNHADWDVCVDCGELRPVVKLAANGTVRRTPRRARSRRWLHDPMTATVGVGLCFVSGGLIAFAVNPVFVPRPRSSEPAQAVAVNATATGSPMGGQPAWTPAAATPPPVTTFQVAPPTAPTPAFTPVPAGFEFSGTATRMPPPVGLYAPSTEYALPPLQAPPPVSAQPSPAQQFAAAQQVVARVRGSVLRIEAEAPAANRRGTGFVIGPRLLVTCAHLVQGTSAIAVALPNGQFLRARLERLDALNDLALLSTLGDLPPALTLDPSGRAEPGEPVAVTGFPSDPENAGGGVDFTSAGTLGGWVVRNSPSGERVQMLQVAADIRPGHSGGPLYSLRDGRVLGVMSFRVVGESVTGFAAGIPMLQQLLSPGAPPRSPVSTLEAAP